MQLFITFVCRKIMVKHLKHILPVAALALTLAACDGGGKPTGGPIVLGDSSTIVTETDQNQLKDMVTDLNPVIPPAENKDQDPTPTADTPAASQKPAPAGSATTAPTAAAKPATPAAAAPASSGPGLRAEFEEVTIQIPGLGVKQAGNKNLRRNNGAVYTLTSGNINGGTLQVNGTITKVSQRYQTVVMLHSNMGDMLLEPLSVTTDWKTVKGGNGNYPITGLSEGSLEYYEAEPSDIRNAVQKLAKRRRMNSRKAQALLNSVRHTRNPKQKPLSVELRSVMWKIDGKDAKGRAFSKQVRVDIPL